MVILKTAYDKTVAVYDRKKFAGWVRVTGVFWPVNSVTAEGGGITPFENKHYNYSIALPGREARQMRGGTGNV